MSTETAPGVELVLRDGRRVPIAADITGYVDGMLTIGPGATDFTPEEVIGLVIAGERFDKVEGFDERA